MATNYDDLCFRRFPAYSYDFDSRRQSLVGSCGRQGNQQPGYDMRRSDDPWIRREQRPRRSESRSQQRASRPRSRPATWSDRSDRHGDRYFHGNGSRSVSVSSSHHGDHSRRGSSSSRSDRSDHHGDGYHRDGSRAGSVRSSGHGDRSRSRVGLSGRSDHHGDSYHGNGSRAESVRSRDHSDRCRKRRRFGSRSVERPRNQRREVDHEREESRTVSLGDDQEIVTLSVHFPELWSFSSPEADELQMALWEAEERTEARACDGPARKRPSEDRAACGSARKRPSEDRAAFDGPARKRLCVSGIASQPARIHVNPNHLAFRYLGKYL